MKKTNFKKLVKDMIDDKEQYKIKIADAVNQETESCDDYKTGRDFIQFLEEFPVASDGYVMDVFFNMPEKRQESLWKDYWTELSQSCADLIAYQNSQKYDAELMELAADEVGQKMAVKKLDILAECYKKYKKV